MYATLGKAPETNVFIFRVCIIILICYYRYIDNKIITRAYYYLYNIQRSVPSGASDYDNLNMRIPTCK